MSLDTSDWGLTILTASCLPVGYFDWQFPFGFLGCNSVALVLVPSLCVADFVAEIDVLGDPVGKSQKYRFAGVRDVAVAATESTILAVSPR